MSLVSSAWSNASGMIPGQTLTDISGALTALIGTESTNTGSGTVNWAFSLADKDVDFLAAGETLTLVYDVSVKDNSGAANATSAAQTVTVVLTGTNDRPMITSSAETVTVPELTNTTGSSTPDAASGTLSFTDVDLDDKHTTAVSLVSSAWSNASGTIPGQTLTDISGALTALIGTDSTNTGSGTVNWAFSLADKDVDFLAAGETLTLVYDVSVKDNSGAANATSAAQTVTVVLTGTNDRPVITSSAEHGDRVAGADQLRRSSSDARPATASGTLSFKDVDLDDTHTTAVVATGIDISAWSNASGTIPGQTQADISGALTALIGDREHQYRLGHGELELQPCGSRTSTSWLRARHLSTGL